MFETTDDAAAHSARNAVLPLLNRAPVAWILGIATLSPAPATTEHVDLQELVDRTVEVGFFPNGRASFEDIDVTRGHVTDENGTRCVEYVAPEGPGRLLVALQGSDTLVYAHSLPDGVPADAGGPQGFLLPDVEAVFADLFALAYTLAAGLDHVRGLTMSVSLHDHTPDNTARTWIVDEDCGTTAPAPTAAADVPVVGGRTEMGLELEAYLELTRAVSRDIAHAFGVETPQWVPESDTPDVEAELTQRRHRLAE